MLDESTEKRSVSSRFVHLAQVMACQRQILHFCTDDCSLDVAPPPTPPPDTPPPNTLSVVTDLFHALLYGTGETTAVGEPRPGPLGRAQEPPQAAQRTGLGPQLGAGLAMGAGVGLVFGLMRVFVG